MLCPNRVVRILIWSVIVGLAFYSISVVASDLRAVASSVVKLGLIGWAAVLGLSLVNYGVRFLRWQGYLARLEHRVPSAPSLAYYLSGFAFTTTPGKAGEAVRCLYLKRHGVAYTDSLAALFAERVMDLVAMVLLAFSAALAFPNARWPVAALMGGLLLILPLLHSQSLHGVLDRQHKRIPSDKLQAFGGHLLALFRSASVLLRSRPIYAGLTLGLLAWGAEGIAFRIILSQLDINVSATLAVGIYAISALVGALSFIPGGLGSTEATMWFLLKLVGADTVTAVAATVICRLTTLWFAVAIGLAVFVGIEMRTRRGKPGASAR